MDLPDKDFATMDAQLSEPLARGPALSIPTDRGEFEGFDRHYREVIAPFLASQEARRKNAVTLFAVGLTASGAIATLLYLLKPLGGASIHVAILAIVFGVGLANAPLGLLKRRLSDDVLAKVCDWFGFDYRPKIDRPAYAQTLIDRKLFGAFNREDWEDAVTGAYRDCGFTLCEARLRYRSSGKSRSTRTVFDGQILAIDYPRSFASVTVLRRDLGLANRLGKPGKDFSRVGLASPEFEKAFEAWSRDQVEAHTLLDPIVLERFNELNRLFNNAGLQAVFEDGKLLIAVQTGDRLAIGTMFKPLTSPERVETILKEFDVSFDLIDVAVASVSGRLTGALTLDAIRRAT